MTLDAYLRQEKLTNRQFSERLQKAGFKGNEKYISRVRRGEVPGGKLALGIDQVTHGAVTAGEVLKPGRSKAALRRRKGRAAQMNRAAHAGTSAEGGAA